MVLSKTRVFATKKYIRANSAAEAIELDKTTPVHEAYLCNDPSKDDEADGAAASAVGFKTVEPFPGEDDPEGFLDGNVGNVVLWRRR